MSVLVNLLETLLIFFLCASYLSCGYIAFIRPDKYLKEVSLSLRAFLWMLSPLVVLDLLIEKIFGWSFMS